MSAGGDGYKPLFGSPVLRTDGGVSITASYVKRALHKSGYGTAYVFNKARHLEDVNFA